MSALHERRCRPLPADTPALSAAEIDSLRTRIDPAWELNAAGDAISRRFRFADYHQAMGFANAVAWIANSQDHHPDLAIGWGRCQVSYSTHSVGGLSENDFICAARIDRLA